MTVQRHITQSIKKEKTNKCTFYRECAKVDNFYKNVDSFKTKGHPAYEFEREGDNSKILSITHHKFNRVMHNKYPTRFEELTRNPDTNDKRDAFVSPYPFMVKTKQLKNKVNWSFDANDIDMIEDLKTKKSK